MNEPRPAAAHGDLERQPLAVLMLGALGVVYGDIGTSPLYAMKETFGGPHPLTLDELHVLGVLSLIFWAVMIVVSVKYAGLIMRADNRGEGGSLALLALVGRVTSGSRMAFPLMVLGLFAASLFYGDSMITPAISVLSAVEGLQVASPALADFVIPLTLAILVGLFVMQSKGTGAMGVLFGPVMALWFGTLAVLGVMNVIQHPSVLSALNPVWAARFFVADGWTAFLALGSVVLAVTGAEALYTDMGHFGRRPIRAAWFWFVLPALMLNYMGQGALLLRDPTAVENPFYLLAPEHLQLALVGLATLATIIASQAVISGAFTVTLQAIQLGFLPRMRIRHTSAHEKGQIYLPFINWSLLFFVVALVLGFRSSSNLASAYGIAVTGTMLIDTLLIAVVMFMLWKWSRLWAGLVLIVFLLVDVAFFAANSTKIAHGGWFPLAVGIAIFTLLVTWKRGRTLLAERIREESMPLETFIETSAGFVERVPGTAVFMTGATVGTPSALLHNLKHNKVLHERVVLLTVQTQEIPFVAEADRVEVEPLDHNFFRVVGRYGFMDEPDVPALLLNCASHGLEVEMMETSFFLSRETLIPSVAPGMALWRERIFAWMSRNAQSPMDFFKLPVNRVVELGTQVAI